ncbi:MAG: DUF2148 domain-containing protein [Candidatus Omnitrophica bacterium]|nr:DUF2148 domain-containing protein [Candidatus Omnitrophota bacterium]
MRKSTDLEHAAVKDVVEFMAAAARTAPKTCGLDNIEMIVIDLPTERDKLTQKMRELSKNLEKPSMARDADSIKDSSQVLVIGVKSSPPGLSCNFCGYDACAALVKAGGVCAYNSIDLGIAVGSATSIAADFRVDNRVMYSIGKAAMELGLLGKDVKQALGIPLSVTGKSPFFDRK